MNIYLIGYRCTGKSSIGRCLARELNMTFVDADRLLEQEAGMHISDYVSRYGWERFRDQEADILRELSRRQELVVATGGGAVLREENVACMKATGTLVWLTAGPETVLARMNNDGNSLYQRPALSQDPLAEEVRSTLAQRTPLYKNACHIRAATDDATIEQICQTLLPKIRSRHARK